MNLYRNDTNVDYIIIANMLLVFYTTAALLCISYFKVMITAVAILLIFKGIISPNNELGTGPQPIP